MIEEDIQNLKEQIEEDNQDLKNQIEELKKIVIHLSKAVITEPIGHSKKCKAQQRELAERDMKRGSWKEIGYYRYCSCDSDDKNDLMDYQREPTLEPEEIEEMEAKHREAK